MRARDSQKEAIVRQTALLLIVQEGIQHFSMNRLARACNISVGTLYIYYRDKNDLIYQLGLSVSRPFFDIMLRKFCAEMNFREGLWQQWQNRVYFNVHFPLEAAFVDILRHTAYSGVLLETMHPFRETMGVFVHRAIQKKELIPISSLHVFWSVAYGPLYILLRFHYEQKGINGEPFSISEAMMQEAFEMVMRALTPIPNP